MRRTYRAGFVVATVFAAAILIAGCSGGVGPVGPQATGEAQQSAESPAAEEPSGTTSEGTTSEPSAGGTLSGACLEISEAMGSASTEMGTAIQDGMTNPEGVKEALLLQAQALQEAVKATAYSEVKTALQAVADDMSTFAAVFEGLPDLANPSSWANDPVALEKVTQLGPKLQAAGTELQASVGELLTLCNYTP